MSTNAPSNVTQLEYIRTLCRDPLGDDQLFSNDEYETFLWGTVQYQRTMHIWARKHDANRALWRWISGIGDAWRVEVESPVTGATYNINEPAGIVFNPEGNDTADPIGLMATMVDVKLAAFRALMAGAADPARAAVYSQSNGLVLDTRQAAEAMRTQAMQIRGVA